MDLNWNLELNLSETTRLVSQNVSNLKGKSKVCKVQVTPANTDTFWGSPKWLDEEGKPKQEYMYDEQQLNANYKKDSGIEI